MTYLLAPDIRIEESAEGTFLVAPRPLRLLRMNGPLLALVRRMTEKPLQPESAAAAKIIEELVRRGFVLRAEAAEKAPTSLPKVSIVIPVKDRQDELAACLASLDTLDYPRELREVIVVDDGSSDASAAVARHAGATVLPSGGIGRGPAAARNRGAEAATGDILAFIDSDCTAASAWLTELVDAFADPQVVAVGGLVEGMYRATALDRYEAAMSSLSLGKQERSGQGGTDTFYLPSCNLLVRRTAFARAGAFRPGMHVGEDVDLTWRLRDGGGRIVYRPQGRVWHAHRNALRAFLKRRFQYGTSEGMLQSLHPQRRKRMAFPPLLCAVLAGGAAALTGAGFLWLLFALLLLFVDASIVRRQSVRSGLRLGYFRVLAARLRTAASLAYYLAFHLVRYYGPPLLALGSVWTAGWPLLLFILLWPAAVNWYVRKPALWLPVFCLFYLLEHLAYGAGVFRGCLEQKSFASYRLQFQQRMPLVF